jgi:hypothetical protein
MTTVQKLKESLIKDIIEAVGVELVPGGKMSRSIESFMAFLERKGIRYIEEFNIHLLGEYRLLLRVFKDEKDEEALVSTVGAFLSVAILNGWISEELLTFWEVVGPNEYFTRKTDSLN